MMRFRCISVRMTVGEASQTGRLRPGQPKRVVYGPESAAFAARFAVNTKFSYTFLAMPNEYNPNAANPPGHPGSAPRIY
jgi:hypothetical protein